MILRRDKDIHEEGTFETVEADTGTPDTTYTDESVELQLGAGLHPRRPND